jgi:PTS system nitrogen regulatory IIA component
MYLNLTQIAESLGVSEHVVTEWVRKENMPHVHDRGRILFEKGQVLAWAARKGLAANAGFLAQPGESLTAALDLAALLKRGGIWRDIPPADLPQVFERILGGLPGLTPAVHGMLMHRMSSSDGLTVAPTGKGFALPHPTSGVFLGESCALVSLIQLNAPWPWAEAPDGIPVTRLLFFISPTPRQHVNMLGLLARSISSGILERALNEGADDEALSRALVAGSGQQPAARKGGSR